MSDAKYVATHYRLGKADLFAAFLLRGLELVREGGVSSMLTMRNWMFIKQYSEFREKILTDHTLQAIGDVSWGAFREMRDNPVAMSIVGRGRGVDQHTAVVIAPTDPQERVRTQEEFAKKDAGLLCHVGRHNFDPAALKVVPEWPLVYWWDGRFLKDYSEAHTVGDKSPARKGVCTSNNGWFIRRPWEIASTSLRTNGVRKTNWHWAPYVMGAAGKAWMEPISFALEWSRHGLIPRH